MFRNYFKFAHILTAIMMAAAFSFTGCADGDYATVRININLPDNVKVAQRPSLLDRVLSVIMMSKPVYAEPAPEWIHSIELFVSGPGMNTITKEIPADTGYLTVDVPAGQSRKFTVEANYDDDGTIRKAFGGIKVIDLTPGTNELKIELGDIPIAPVMNDINLADIGIYVEWYVNEEIEIHGFNIYRAPGAEDTEVPQGSFRRILSRELSFFPYNDYYSHVDSSGNMYNWYRVSAYNEYGESDLSNYVAQYWW